MSVMKEGWTYKKLGEVCETTSGGTPLKTHKEYYEGGTIPWLRSGEIAQGSIYNTELYITELGLKNSSAKILPINTVVIAMYGATVGQVGTLKNEMATNQAVCGILPNSYFNPQFLMYFLKSKRSKFLMEAAGGAQANISQAIIKNTYIPIISLPTQQSIVSELDKINELIAIKKSQLKDLDALAQSIFYEMFGDPITNEKGWEVKKLGLIALVKTGPFGSMLHKEDYISNGIPLINPMHMKDYHIVADMDFTITKEKAVELSNYLLQCNDIIFARRGDIGRCAIVSDNEKGYLCGTGCLFVRFEDVVEPNYITYIIRSDSFKRELISKAKGATMLNLNSTTISELQIPLPPLSLQHQFAERVESIERMKQQVQTAIKDLETLLASRMQYWFD